MSALTIRCTLLAGLALAAANCATTPSSSVSSAWDETQIEITNNNWATAAVYAVRGGWRSRIGTVETGQTALLRLRGSASIEDVRVLIHPIGGGEDYLSPVLPRVASGRIALTVENYIAMSFLSVR